MDHLISKAESYSRAMTEKVTGDFFSQSESISGDQILKITPVEQVNLFVIKNLFEKWKEETNKLKSPYFDYERDEVKNALESFLIILSKNISIKKEFFKPLLQKAIQDTLLFLLDPQQFFEKEINDGGLDLGRLKEQKKYFRIGREQVESLLTSTSLTSPHDFLNKVKTVFQEKSIGEELKQKVISDFSTVLPFEIQNEIKQEKELHHQPKSIPAEEVGNEKDPGKEVKILNEKFAGNQLTLNDILRSSENVSLADKIGKSKVQNIREVISLNQKFMFITTLFQGERTEYENALNYVERSSTYEEAFEYLENNYASRYQWETGKPELLELKELIYRKFS